MVTIKNDYLGIKKQYPVEVAERLLRGKTNKYLLERGQGFELDDINFVMYNGRLVEKYTAEDLEKAAKFVRDCL